jgi:mRNA interferase MazF
VGCHYRASHGALGRSMTTTFEPWQVWWIDFDPTVGRERAGRRPAIIVSSRFHLALTGDALINTLPLSTRERPGWSHRVQIDIPGKPTGFAITEQIRTVSRTRLAGRGPLWHLTNDQIASVRAVLSQMLDL